MNGINPLQERHDLYRAALDRCREYLHLQKGVRAERLFDIAHDELKAERKDAQSIIRNHVED